MTSKRIVLRFPHHLIEQPVVYRLVKDYNLEPNILKASITPNEEGLMVLEIKGEQRDIQEGVDYVKRIGIQVQSLQQDIIRNEERCTHCGACVAVCPVGAMAVDPVTRKVVFDDSKCVACELCVPACPPRAMEIHF